MTERYDKKLRFGLVGCGVIGPTHAQAIASLPDAQLVAVTDIIPEKAQRLADEYAVKPYTALAEMLAGEQLDVVIICTPSGLHGEQACQVMRSGRHVIVEKPMEISHAAIEEMLRVQQESGVKLAVISQHRFDPASLQVHDLVEEQAFGRLVLGNAIVPWWRSQAYYDSGAWRGTWQLDGGGVLMNQSIHSIDLLQWFMGPVRSVYAYTDTLTHHIETEDVAVAILRFANGALGTIAATTSAYPGVTTRIEIFGDKGSAVIEDDNLSYLHLAREDSQEIGAYGIAEEDRHKAPSSTQPHPLSLQDAGSVPGGAEGSEMLRFAQHDDAGAADAAKRSGARIDTSAQDAAALSFRGHALQIADMIRAIREDGTPVVDGQAARRPVEIILGIYESARTHKEVTLS